jgi:sialate O-acetylesterase
MFRVVAIALAVVVDCASSVPLPWISNVFGSHMVLQQAPASAVLFGWSNATSSVVKLSLLHTLNNSVAEQHVVTPDWSDGGRWVVRLRPRSAVAGRPIQSFTVIVSAAGVVRASLTDVLFGEVWLCSGQSNMVFPLAFDFNATAEFAAADQRAPQLRFIDLGTQWENVVDAPAHIINKQSIPWTRATAAMLNDSNTNDWPGLSAVCYEFARRLLERLDVPIGVVDSSWGGTIIQAWMPADGINACPAADAATLPASATNPANNYSALFNGMILPFVGGDGAAPMVFQGVVWDQGEQNGILADNSGGPGLYGCLFRSLISSWRTLLGAVSFHFVQVPGTTNYYQGGDPDGFYPSLRLEQASVLENSTLVCMASAVDAGDWNSPFGSVHPRLKEPVAQRLFQCAMAVTYLDKSVPFAGPQVVKAVRSANSTVSVHFSNVGTGLVAEYTNTTEHETFCPVDRLCVNCCAFFDVELGLGGNWAAISLTDVQISSPTTLSIAVPRGLRATRVRYLYGDWPIAVLYNSDLLPMTPFVVSVHE